jgi:uncharacterized membrane-anchored protein YhcB (DUF1043 family)
MPPAELAAWLQLGAIVVGIGAVLIRVGGREQTLQSNTKAIEELGEIVKDLVRFQVTHETNAQHTAEVLKDIRSRLTRLETLRWGSLSEQKGL